MKLRPMTLFGLLALMAMSTVVQADPWSAIDSGYAVSTNYHGEETPVPPDPPLMARVGVLLENFALLDYVEVHLRDPSDDVVDIVVVPASAFVPGLSPKGADIMEAWSDPLEPEEGTWLIGHYSVKAYFYAVEGAAEPELANCEDLEAMRATTVMTIPEVPIGTLTVLLAMIAGLAIFARKRA